MVAVFIVYQQLENHLLQPVIYGRTVQLSPLMVLISILIAGSIAGIIGALIAIPIAGSLQVVLLELLAARRERLLARWAPTGLCTASPVRWRRGQWTGPHHRSRPRARRAPADEDARATRTDPEAPSA